MTRLVLPLLGLVVIGAAWGGTQPLGKIAVSEGYRHFGLLFWQTLIGTVVLGGICFLRGQRLPLGPAYLRLYLILALVGSVLPGIASYSAAVHLPAGVLSILLSSIPLLAFPMAIALGNDQFRYRRLIGLGLGLSGVALLVLPESSLPDPAQSVWIPVALISSAFYAFESNFVARWGTMDLGPFRVIWGASLVGMCLTLPLALISGQFIDPRGTWGAPDYALVASSLLHVGAYSGYVWLVGAAGSVFAVQVSYFVTLFGVIWAMLFLGEAYSAFFWAALAVMLGGLALVQPRPRAPLVNAAPLSQNVRVRGQGRQPKCNSSS
ncbi:DMT family transporter [Puniceibacterium sediminis]|uniref:Permease of the drug/metabolite transporter (DMT) superfamily n=1 Tax=Puniceibacterium sediminis TaxID=1608407 RepID=A0A238XAH9_9RHOB|nr:DMT family transporter [Puniceibacterium sediminis]SNR56045.1 Permease of the drug/metabolite transporter (DMT) superfamily [Puniceibacterium sediminis]